ncbi:SpoIVB peptidase S55 [Terriglobus sp. ADX1]
MAARRNLARATLGPTLVDVILPRKATLATAALAAVLPVATAAAQNAAQPPLHADTFPLSEVHRGLHGTAWTVFEGTDPEPMDVEILGRLKDAIGPGQDMILARLHGAKPEFTGVVAGMSGSPVYIDGKLLGALAYRIGQFSKEPICGITPIGSMLQVRDLPTLAPPPIATPLSKASVSETSPEIHAIDTPLVFSGFSQDTIAKYADNFRTLGLEPVSGIGSASPDTPQPQPIIPGSAVSAILARGDLNVAATCTVTYVDAKQLLACGHPMTQYGDISIPMTKSEVIATLASPMNAFKIVNSTETVGSFTQDRANAVAGTFGRTARMIPVAVDITPEPGSGLPAQSLHFEVLDNRQLTPQIMLAAVYQSLNQNNTAANQMSLRLTGDIALEDAEGRPGTVHLASTFAASDNQPAAQLATLSFAQKFLAVFGNDLAQPKITGIHLHAVAVPRRESAELETARLSTNEAQPGDTIQVEATIRPFQRESRVVRIPITLPTTLTPGPLRIFVSDGPSLDRLLTPPPAAGSVNLGVQDTVAQLNRTHSNDRLYVTLLDHQTQAVTAAAALPSLPPSIANVLQPMRGTRQITFTSETAAEAGSAPAEAQLSGAEVLTIRIR